MYIALPGTYCGLHDENIILEENESYGLASYSPNVRHECKYVINVPKGHRVRVQFLSFGLMAGNDALFLDKKTFTGFKIPADYISDDATLEIVYGTRGFERTEGYSIVLSAYSEPG